MTETSGGNPMGRSISGRNTPEFPTSTHFWRPGGGREGGREREREGEGEREGEEGRGGRGEGGEGRRGGGGARGRKWKGKRRNEGKGIIRCGKNEEAVKCKR